jgi:hypothetical protein
MIGPASQPWWSRQRLPLIVLAAGLLGTVAVASSRERIAHIRYLRDDVDRGVYMERGSFVLRPGARPYRDVFSEYPQVATYLFAIPHLHAVVHGPDRKLYMDVFTASMALVLFALAMVWRAAARDMGVDERRGLLLLLPGTLYFTLNRFDVIPALLVLSAVLLLLRRRVVAAHAVLAVAVLTKAYPIAYLPLFAVTAAHQGGWRKALAGLAALGAVLAALSLQLALWSGPAAVLAPYRWQLGRDGNGESLYHLLCSAVPALQAFLRPAFLALQVAFPIAAAAAARTTSSRAFVRWACAITVAFVVFTRFQSPQWVVWITPLALLGAVTPAELALTVLQDVLAYVYFPIVFDSPHGPLPAVLWTLTAVRLGLVALLLRDPGRVLARRYGAQVRLAA